MLHPLGGLLLMEQIFYNGGMKTDIELKTGNWLLVVGSRTIVPTLLKMTARLAVYCPEPDLASSTMSERPAGLAAHSARRSCLAARTSGGMHR
jgi:hypothetical protein